MASYFGMNSTGISTLFSSMNSKNSNAGLYSLFSQYKTIQTGSYHKLLKAYYQKDTASSTKESSSTKPKKDTATEVNSTLKDAATNVSALKASTSSLSSAEYTEEKRSDLEKDIAGFVSNYNSTLNSSSKIASATLAKRTDWMTRITSNNSDALQKVGITVNSDNTLSLDKTALSAASLSDIKSVFSGKSSYAGQVNSSANLMAQVISNGTASTTASLYNGNGSYSSLSASSMFDYLL